MTTAEEPTTTAQEPTTVVAEEPATANADILKAKNQQLHQRLLSLNSELDALLLKHGEKFVVAPTKASRREYGDESRPVFRQNELLRKENAKLVTELKNCDVHRVQDLHNAIAVKDRRIADLQAEIRGMEAVQRNQEGSVSEAMRMERELRELQYEHNNELADLRATLKQKLDLLKVDEKTLKIQLGKQATLQDKVKTGVTREEVQKLIAKLETNQQQIAELRERHNVVTSHANEERAQARNNQRPKETEIANLQQQAEYLRQVLKHREKELKLSYNKPRASSKPRKSKGVVA